MTYGGSSISLCWTPVRRCQCHGPWSLKKNEACRVTGDLQKVTGLLSHTSSVLLQIDHQMWMKGHATQNQARGFIGHIIDLLCQDAPVYVLGADARRCTLARESAHGRCLQSLHLTFWLKKYHGRNGNGSDSHGIRMSHFTTFNLDVIIDIDTNLSEYTNTKRMSSQIRMFTQFDST